MVAVSSISRASVVTLLLAALGTAAAHAWLDLPLVDARSGETFTLRSFEGRTVFVEPMATWCSSCRRQMGVVREVAATLDPDEVVFVALSVETNLAAEALARYADANDFPWTFAVMTPEFLRAFTEAYGRSAANPPATPHVVVAPDGSPGALSTGLKDAGALRAALQAAAQP
jgi:thiol-disulfide isomerase/thioredoxin